MWKNVLAAIGTVLGVCILLIGASIGGLIGKEAAKSAFSPSKQEVEAKVIEGFKKAASQYNQRLPMMIDQDTRLDKVTVGPGPRAVYHYTFPRYTSRNIDINFLQENLEPDVVRKVCANADMKKSLQYGGIYVYAYYGNNGVEITRFEIDRNVCGFPRLP
jgi:hypothetical protein